jgi:hypothetical protein
MPVRELYDTGYASGNPGIYGGFTTQPTEEQTYATVLDQSTTVATVGKILVRQMTNTNTGACNYVQSATANQRLMGGEYGVVVVGASATGGKAFIKTRGVANAFVQNNSNTSKTINAGDDLALDGLGNMTSAPSNPYAAAVATAMFALSGAASATVTPELLLVNLGGSY